MTRFLGRLAVVSMLLGLLIVGTSAARADLVISMAWGDGTTGTKTLDAAGTYTINVYAAITGVTAGGGNDTLANMYFALYSNQVNGGAVSGGGFTAGTLNTLLQGTSARAAATGGYIDYDANGLTDTGKNLSAVGNDHGFAREASTGAVVYDGVNRILVGTYTFTVSSLVIDPQLDNLTELLLWLPSKVGIPNGAAWLEDGVSKNSSTTSYRTANASELANFGWAGSLAFTVAGEGPPPVTPSVLAAVANNSGVASQFGAAVVLDVTGTGGALAGWGSQVVGYDPAVGAGNPSVGWAKFLAGTNLTDVTMAWRSRVDEEAAVAGFHLVSDVVKLDGVEAGTVYVLAMSYDPTAPAIAGAEEELAAAGKIYLGWWDGADWVNAVLGNDGGLKDLQSPILGEWSGQTGLGQWGVDIENNVVWAVLNHNSEFAVVPEPATMAFLAIGGLAMAGAGLARRRRRV